MLVNLIEKFKESFVADIQDASAAIKEQKSPMDLLNRTILECEAEVKKAEKLIERQILLKKEFLKQLTDFQKLAEKRREQVRIAEEAGANELAETALRYQAQAEEQVNRLQQAYDEAVNQQNELEEKYDEMKLKVKDMHIKRLELMGRENVLSMKEKMNKVFNESEFGKGAGHFEDACAAMKQKETKVDDEFDVSVFDAKIQKLAKEINQAEKQKDIEGNVVQ